MNVEAINNFIVLLAVILIDQMTKNYAIDTHILVSNQGMMFGSFSDTSAVVRVSLIASGSIIFFMIYYGLIYFLSESLGPLKFGISFLFGGALSNAIDKVYLNFVVDFIPISLGNYLFHANVADIIQLVGVVVILYYMFFCQDEIWFPDDKRGVILISPTSQLLFAFKFFVVCMSALLMISLFSYTYMEVEFDSFSGHKRSEFVSLALMLSSIFSLLIFIFGVFLSHHFYGPIYKLNKYIENNEWDQNFILREKDQFKELEILIKKLRKKFLDNDN